MCEDIVDLRLDAVAETVDGGKIRSFLSRQPYVVDVALYLTLYHVRHRFAAGYMPQPQRQSTRLSEDVISRMPYMRKATHEELVAMLPHRWKLTYPGSVMADFRATQRKTKKK